jgi:hypothetical protein
MAWYSLLAEAKLLGDKSIRDKIWTAQNWFTFHRLIDDYYFHGFKKIADHKKFDQHKLSSRILDDKTNEEVERYATQILSRSFAD